MSSPTWITELSPAQALREMIVIILKTRYLRHDLYSIFFTNTKSCTYKIGTETTKREHKFRYKFIKPYIKCGAVKRKRRWFKLSVCHPDICIYLKYIGNVPPVVSIGEELKE